MKKIKLTRIVPNKIDNSGEETVMELFGMSAENVAVVLRELNRLRKRFEEDKNIFGVSDKFTAMANAKFVTVMKIAYSLGLKDIMYKDGIFGNCDVAANQIIDAVNMMELPRKSTAIQPPWKFLRMSRV